MTGDMPARLRVTVVAPAGVIGGAELWLLALLAATDRVEVDAVLLSAGPLQAELAKLGIPVRLLPTGRRPRELAAAAARLAAHLRRPSRRPDLVLANGVKAAVVAAPAARLAAVRCVWAKHDHSYDGLRTALLARLLDGVVATSAPLAEASRRAGAVVVPPPRPARPLPRDLTRLLLGSHGLDSADPRPVLAVVGRLVRYKGVEDAVRALAEPGGREWRLLVIGAADPAEPGEADRLRRLAGVVGVADRVVFAGPVPAAAGLLTGVDAVAVLTKPAGSGPDREGFGMVALEAMVAGVPVVATGPGPVEARLAGRAGIVVRPDAPAEVGAALGRLADPAVRARMGAAGRQLTAEHPTARGCASLLVRELARVAARPGAGLDAGPGGAALLAGPPISVVVTVLDEAGAVDALLAPLVAQLAHSRDEIVVVDGGSRDGTAARVQAWAEQDCRVRLLVRPGAGISAGRNAGIREAANGLVACTDAGCEPAPGWLAAFRAAAADAPAADGAAAGLLTGVYRVRGRGPVQLALAAVGYPDPAELRRPSLLVRAYGRLFGRTFDPSLPTGRSMAFPVPVWAAVGGFPEHLQTGEDVLFGRAVAASGLPTTLVADAAVTWAQRPTVAATAGMYFRYGRGSGRSRDPRLLGRDLARLAGYAAAPWLLARGGRPARAALLAAGVGYLSLPAVRVLRAGPDGPGRVTRGVAVAALPPAAALRDLAKAAGALYGLVTGWRRR
jgi:glycosyltransferase involved in cell wall biosynthesis/GT2 family glycosyltransferase